LPPPPPMKPSEVIMAMQTEVLRQILHTQ
jgi:hypothetical protein